MKSKILLLILVVFLVGCMHENLFGGGGKQSAGKGIRMELTSFPRTLEANEPFSLSIRLTNYVKDLVQGNLCVFDSPSDRFGGIPQRECASITLQPIELTQDGKQLPDQQDINFPTGGTYSYHSLDPEITHGSVITAIFRYITQTKANAPMCIKNPMVKSSSVPIPCPDEESLSIKQPDTPIKVSSVKKSVSRISDSEVKLRIEMNINQVDEGEIFSQEEVQEIGLSKDKGIEFSADYGGIPLSCTPIVQGKVDLREKERVIKCNAIINVGQDFISNNLVITLRYGFQQSISTPEIKLETEPLI